MTNQGNDLVSFFKTLKTNRIWLLFYFVIFSAYMIIILKLLTKDFDNYYKQLKYDKTEIEYLLYSVEKEIYDLELKIKKFQSNNLLVPTELEIQYKKDIYTLNSKNKDELIIFLGKLDLNHKIIIYGHADEAGSIEYNDKLSEKRAHEVRNFILATNPNFQIKDVISLGEKMPKYNTETEFSNSKNRRVLIIALDSSESNSINNDLIIILNEYEKKLANHNSDKQELIERIENLEDTIKSYEPKEPSLGSKSWNFINTTIGLLASLLTLYIFWRAQRKKG